LLVVGDDEPVWTPIERVEHEAERGAAASGAQRANLPAPPPEARGSVAAAETAAPEVRILAAERTTLADIPFVSFSCQATNPNKVPVMFVGYRPDSFGPPLQDGQIAPIYVVELKRDGEWKAEQCRCRDPLRSSRSTGPRVINRVGTSSFRCRWWKTS
jgi:hypothetical protein